MGMTSSIVTEEELTDLWGFLAFWCSKEEKERKVKRGEGEL